MRLFDREGRRERARVQEIRELLAEVGKGEFLDHDGARVAPHADDDSSLRRALARRAHEAGLSPDGLLASYLQQIATTKYPTPECLHSGAVQELAGGRAPSEAERQHLESCVQCRQLVEHASPEPDEVEKFLHVVRSAPAEVGSAKDRPWAQFLQELEESVENRAMSFGQAHPSEAPIALIDNHDVVDPEEWDKDPRLARLRGVLREAQEAFEAAHANTMCRVVVLKDDLSGYHQADFDIIRRAISDPTTRGTYLVSSARAGAYRRRACGVVGDDTVFDMPVAGVAINGSGEHAPAIVRNRSEAHEIRQAVANLCSVGVAVYLDGRPHPRFEWAIASSGNERLRELLDSIIRTGEI
jgi:hypothetical protein